MIPVYINQKAIYDYDEIKNIKDSAIVVIFYEHDGETIDSEQISAKEFKQNYKEIFNSYEQDYNNYENMLDGIRVEILN